MTPTAQDTGGGDRGLWLQLFPEDLRRLAQDRDTFTKYVYPLARWHMGLDFDPPDGPEADFIFGKLQDQQRRSAQSQQAKRDGAKMTNAKRWGGRDRKRIGSESVATIQRPGSESNIDNNIDTNKTSTVRERGSATRAHTRPASVDPADCESLINSAAVLLQSKPSGCELERWREYVMQYGTESFNRKLYRVVARGLKNGQLRAFNESLRNELP